MKLTTEAINQYLIREDIEGFIELGAPEDEYSDEARLISEKISELENSMRTQENIYRLIQEIWKSKFNLGDEELVLREDALKRLTMMCVADCNG